MITLNIILNKPILNKNLIIFLLCIVILLFVKKTRYNFFIKSKLNIILMNLYLGYSDKI
jgi:hypothetical protein